MVLHGDFVSAFSIVNLIVPMDVPYLVSVFDATEYSSGDTEHVGFCD